MGASLCDEAQRLLKAQKQYESAYKENFAKMSVQDTCARLLAMGELKVADKFRSEFRIPDRRYWWLRIRALAQNNSWAELEQLAKAKKPPIGFGPFVDVCLEMVNQSNQKKVRGTNVIYIFLEPNRRGFKISPENK